VYSTVLQRWTDLPAAVNTFKDIHAILCSKTESDAVWGSKERLTALAPGIAVPVLDFDENDRDLEDQVGVIDAEKGTDYAKGTLKERSPFCQIFNIEKLSETSDADELSNALYSPNSFRILQDNVHLFPLW